MAKWLPLVLIVLFSLILTVLMFAGKEATMENKLNYQYEILKREETETEAQFVERVFDFMGDKVSYDVTYSKFSYGLGSVKGYVVTRRPADVKFYDTWGRTNKAIVWWFPGLDKYPQKIEEIEKGMKK